MPKNNKSNNVSRTAGGELSNYGGNLHEAGCALSGDSRSQEEKVSDLTDLFIGDYHIDTDIIHAALEECSWNVEDASAKLFEVFFANKPNEGKINEPDDLATIACSILMHEEGASDKTSNMGREDSLSHRTPDLLTHSAVHNQKQNNTCLRQKVTSSENLAQYNYSAQNVDVKSSSESKTLFEPKTGHHDFYNKNSFGDMAVNMERYESSMPKTSNQNVKKKDSLLDGNKNWKVSSLPQKTKPRLDLSQVSVNDATSLNKVENVSVDAKNNASAFYSDKSMESLISSSHSPSTSVEWDMFYKHLNLQPLQMDKPYSDLNVNELLKNAKVPDVQSQRPKKSEVKTSLQSKISNDTAQDNFNFTNRHSPISKPNNQMGFQIPKSSSVIRGKNSPSPEKDQAQEFMRETNGQTMREQQIPESVSLNVGAPEFKPRALEVRQPMRKKSPEIQATTQTYPYYNGNLLHSPDKSINCNFKKGKGVTFHPVDKPVQAVDHMDPLSWRETQVVPSKTPKPKLQTDTNGSHHHHDSKNKQFNRRNKAVSSNDNIPDSNAVVVPPFSFNVISPSNSNKKNTGKKKGKVPKSQDVAVDTHSMTSGPASPAGILKSSQPFFMSQPPPMLSLPPSLSRNQPPNSVEFRKKDMSNHVVPKVNSAQGNDINNKVQFVGVKTPLGKLKHYIDKKQPVMFILRGLPGSGKSYLAGQLVSECQRFSIVATNLSSDAYFSASGHYSFNRQHLDEAHVWNQKRAQQCLTDKHPVIIIDNTNTTLWEMMHYAEMAILNGYDIQVCEPDTQWKTKLPELARRNQHGVSRDNIKRMKDRYQMLTTEDVIREASKSLRKKNKLPSATTTPKPPAFDQKPPAPTAPTHQVKSSPGKVSLSDRPSSDTSSDPSPLDKTELDGQEDETSSSSDQGLTQWIPVMEQRVTPKRAKKSTKSKTESQQAEITLDFLNNSIKKALVGIEKLQDESPGVVEGFQSQQFDKDSKTTTETVYDTGKETEEETSVFKSIVDNGYDDDDETFTQAKELLTDQQEIHKDEDNSSAVLSSDSYLSPMRGDTSRSSCDSFYSIVSEGSDEIKQKNLRLGGYDEQNLSESVSNFVEIEDKKRVSFLLKTSDSTDFSNQDSVSEADTIVEEKEDSVPNVLLNHLQDKDIETLSNSDNVEPLNVEPGGNVKTNCHSADSISWSGALEERGEVHGKRGNDSNEITAMNEECRVKKIDVTFPSAAALVGYSDSEEEGDEITANMKIPGTLCKKLNSHLDIQTCDDDFGNDGDSDKLISQPICFTPDGISVDEETVDQSKKDTMVELEHNDQPIPALKDPDVNIDCRNGENQSLLGEANTSNVVKEKSPESNSSTREESPSLEDNFQNSPGKKKKKKKPKPVVNHQGPFLEESLREKSKSENWSSFFFNTPSPERQLSPTKTIPKVTVNNVGSQCEPYYFSMIYRLNSEAFNNQQPIDLSNCDVFVIQASNESSWEERLKRDGLSSQIVQRKSETTDRSTITDETLVSEEVDLGNLQSCFPEYSRKQLEEVMAVCQNNVEWVTNHLLDSPPLLDYDDCVGDEVEENSKSSPERKIVRNSQDRNLNKVLPLAQLCRNMFQNDQELDKDDFEQQIIQAGQTRLHEIEKFAWTRLHSYSRENSLMCGIDSWPDNFNLDNFSGRSAPDEMENVMPFQPSTVFPAPESGAIGGVSSVQEVDDHEEDIHHFSAIPASPSVPILPFGFIHGLEKLYGPLDIHVDESGLVLNDHTARKIYNCLKLQVSKKQVGTEHDRQLQEDEAMARALQEEENAARGGAVISQNSSVPGWTNQKPSWMTSSTGGVQQQPSSNFSVPKKKSRPAANSHQVNSVSDTLYQLRGSWPKRLKPFKFHSKMQRQLDYSVWTVKSNTGQRPDNMHSIMKEEKDREARLKQMLQVNQASGDKDVLATKIKRSRLRLMFPFLPPDVLEEIFMNNGYSLENTVEVLESHYDRKPVPVSAEMEEEELDNILQQSGKNETFQYLPEEDNILTYDDLRKEAQFKNDLANECRQKAQRYHGEGMHHAAFFYRQEVKKYLLQKDEANQSAAELLFDMGTERLHRENTLDLHSFHINEAIEAVNLALEMKRDEYIRQPERRRAYLTIITGRGRNSKWGIPKLRPVMISHMNNKGLRFEETNTGMFKVHIFQE